MTLYLLQAKYIDDVVNHNERIVRTEFVGVYSSLEKVVEAKKLYEDSISNYSKTFREYDECFLTEITVDNLKFEAC